MIGTSIGGIYPTESGTLGLYEKGRCNGDLRDYLCACCDAKSSMRPEWQVYQVLVIFSMLTIILDTVEG